MSELSRPRVPHVPPEEAFALALLVAESAAGVWQQKRWSLSMRMARMRRTVEFAIEHDHGFTVLVRQAAARQAGRWARH
jgi:Leu/Phe-tRNA-protein transferase